MGEVRFFLHMDVQLFLFIEKVIVDQICWDCVSVGWWEGVVETSEGQGGRALIFPSGHQALNFQPPHGRWTIREAL